MGREGVGRCYARKGSPAAVGLPFWTQAMKWTRTDKIAAANTFIAVIGIVLVLFQLRSATIELERNQRYQKAQVLADLHQRAFSSEEMMRIFQKVEYGQFKFERGLSGQSFHQSPDQLNVIELLSFADFLGKLERLGLLTVEDIAGVFGYYIVRLYHNEEVMKYVNFLRTRTNVSGMPSGGVAFAEFERIAQQIAEPAS